MTKRSSKENAKDRKCSADMDDGSKPPPNKRKRDNGKDTLWINDDTLPTDSSEDAKKPTILLNIHISGKSDEDDEDEDEDEDDEDYNEEEEQGQDFIEYLMDKYVGNKGPTTRSQTRSQTSKKEPEAKIPINLTKKELAYYKSQPDSKRKELFGLMEKMSSLALTEGDVPHKFKVLELPISDYVKSTVIKKISAVEEMGAEAGESYKLRTWIDAFLRIPFGKTIPLPVKVEDGRQKCTEFMLEARASMDKSIYGMVPAKTQIMQILAQLLVNPNSVGNVIALQGPMGVGKTSLARNAIANVMKRPFEFFSLGGASDIANFVGHSYTYEGSMWGRIADSIMHAGAMNPVLYFDELDKVSGTPHGEEVVNMMIHLTDRSQNSQFHDRYFSGVDFDLSQCLFVFSFNDIEKVHPILRDRMSVIHCGGYNETDKKAILKDYIWPQLLDRLKFKPEEIILTDEAIKFLISEYSGEEKGVRTLIRTVETMMTRLNMLRIVNDESMKQYVFFVEYTEPFTITEPVLRKLLTDLNKKDPEHWRAMYN
uniref:ATPase AAA-type core domain-containing protein n=1 Tax=viral metagenome TaxID=1070528 RepID=A0A6C0F098_9ZZZZ